MSLISSNNRHQEGTQRFVNGVKLRFHGPTELEVPEMNISMKNNCLFYSTLAGQGEMESINGVSWNLERLG